ncbi:MAG TPA: ferrochelatase [Acidimicrobiales bacterium]|jgi:ferrochelatase|nr:ferrochelatase [Acidimicrobiales bacterium]
MAARSDHRTGVVVMAYGSPASSDDLEAYYTHIRRGRAPTDEQLANLRARYDALGGVSTLAARTTAQRAALAAALERQAPGRFDVVAGNKHAAPFIEDGVRELAGRGVGDVVTVVLAPHWSAGSVGEYEQRAAAACDEHGIRVGHVHQWHLLPELIDFQARAVRATLDGLGTPEAATKVLFTAHSLPERVLVGDPYPEQLRASASAVAASAGLHPWAGWAICWQSAGATPEPWRGPDVLHLIRELAATGRAEGVVVCPQGFTSDHLEVAYDLDIEAAAVAAEVELAFGRTPVLNDDPVVLGALAAKVAAIADGHDEAVAR